MVEIANKLALLVHPLHDAGNMPAETASGEPIAG